MVIWGTTILDRQRLEFSYLVPSEGLEFFWLLVWHSLHPPPPKPHHPKNPSLWIIPILIAVDGHWFQQLAKVHPPLHTHGVEEAAHNVKHSSTGNGRMKSEKNPNGWESYWKSSCSFEQNVIFKCHLLLVSKYWKKARKLPGPNIITK